MKWALAFLICTQVTLADSQTIRPFLSLRQAGMGGLQYSASGHLESIFGNPALLSFENTNRMEVLNLVTEGSPQTYWRVHKLLGSTDTALDTLGNAAGVNHHLRLQWALFSLFRPAYRTWGKWEWSWGLTWTKSLQGDLGLRKSYRVSSWLALDMGPHFENSFKFKLPHGSLAIGIASHLVYRISNAKDYALTEYIKGNSIDPITSGGDGGHLDFGLGLAYEVNILPGLLGTASAAVQNLRNGPFHDFRFGFTKAGQIPERQPREYGVGLSLKKQAWPSVEDESTLAIELSPIAADAAGSFLKLVSWGGEIEMRKKLAVRAGLHQGYFTAGFGYKTGSTSTQYELSMATYSEELGLTTGEKEDRRLGIEFKIVL